MALDDKENTEGHYSRYWDYYVREQFGHNQRAAGVDYEWPGDEWDTPQLWESLFQQMFIPAGVQDWQRAIEIGQGSGKYTLKVLSNSQATIHTYDVSAEFLKVCEDRCADWIKQDRLKLHILDTNRPDQMLADMRAYGWKRRVDGFYSIDAMVHVDLQFLIVYLLTAAAVLKPGGKLILTLANVTSNLGWRKLLEDIKLFFFEQGKPCPKFEWLSPELIENVLFRLGFAIDMLDTTYRDLRVVASLKEPDKVDQLGHYLTA